MAAEQLSPHLAAFDHGAQHLDGASFRGAQPLFERARAEACVLGFHIEAGLEKIKEALARFIPEDGRDLNEQREDARHQHLGFVLALKHFENVEPLRRCGFDIAMEKPFAIDSLNSRDVTDVLGNAAAARHRTWKDRPPIVVLPRISAPAGFDFHRASPAQLAAMSDLFYGACLLRAESWVHAHQNALGQNVSRRAPFISRLSREDNRETEIDAAFFLQEQGVPMPSFFLACHGRDFELENVKGIQTSEQLDSITKQLQALAPDTELVVGSSAEGRIIFGGRDLDDYARRHLSEHPALRAALERMGRGDDAAQMRVAASLILEYFAGSIAPEHAAIIRRAAGYEVRPYADAFVYPVWVQDPHGHCSMISGPACVGSGVRIRLGGGFEIELP